MPFGDESVPHSQVDERQPGGRWQNFSDMHVVVLGPFEHRHRSPSMSQSDSRCGSGWTSPNDGDIALFAHGHCVPGWQSAKTVIRCVAGTLPTTVSSFIVQSTLDLDVFVRALLFHDEP